MRAVGLDLGRRTLGLALSDPRGIIASPVKTIRFPENRTDYALQDLEEYLSTLDETPVLVLGLPLSLSGEVGIQAEYCLAFKDLLTSRGYQVEMMDERLTTVIAHDTMRNESLSFKKRKEKVDNLAASIILQSWLDRKGNSHDGD